MSKLYLFGDLESFKLFVETSKSGVVLCEGDVDEKQLRRIIQCSSHSLSDDIYTVQAHDINITNYNKMNRIKLEIILTGTTYLTKKLTAILDSDACIDSCLGFEDKRLELPNAFYSNGCTLESYILANISHCKLLVDPLNIFFSSTSFTTQLAKRTICYAVWSVFVRDLNRRYHIKLDKLRGMLIDVGDDKLMEIETNSVELHNISAANGLSKSAYRTSLTMARSKVLSKDFTFCWRLIDKKLVAPVIAHTLRDYECKFVLKNSDLSLDVLFNELSSKSIDWTPSRAINYLCGIHT